MSALNQNDTVLVFSHLVLASQFQDDKSAGRVAGSG